jgi:transcriptional regulator with GAF, ATPase, and Fis domain
MNPPRKRSADPALQASSGLPRIDDLVDRLRLSPATGHIWLDGKRVFMLHATAFGALRRELIENLGTETARGLLTRMGHLAGGRDAELAKKIRKAADIADVFSIGPQMHALEGVVRVEPVLVDFDVARGHFRGEFIWHDSIEAEVHLAEYGLGPEPVCWMQLGFACGYTSAFMGLPILFRETECRAMGHAVCRVVGRPARDWDDARQDLRFFNAQPFANRALAGIAGGGSLRVGSAAQSREAADAPKSRFAHRRLIGVSSAFNAACHMINRVARTTTPVLFLGESGVGKEMFARILHEESDRADAPFVAVNCAAIPESLIEADLFGVEKGAFTGATSTRVGRFERADRGTLLLDEIGSLSLAAQAKLLRVLQEGELERVGDTRTRRIDVRLVAASNVDLAAAVAQGTFREDLYYRLNIFPIGIPPLRDRRDDIPILADYFLQRYSQLHQRAVTGFREDVVDALLAHAWPGNVHELENVIERATLLASVGGAIELAHLPQAVAAARSIPPLPSPARPGEPREELGDGPAALDPIRAGEYRLIKEAIERRRGNLSAAARDLGITRAKVEYKATKLGLQGLFRSRS